MPLLGLEELERMSPMFGGKVGNAFARGLMRLLSVDKVNELYDRNLSLKGPDFASAVLDDIGMDKSILIRPPSYVGTLRDLLPDGPFITISNHPCGHVDGICLVDIFGNERPDYKVMVNSLLARIKPLEDCFIPVTPTGSARSSPTSASISGVKAALMHIRSGGSLGLFPAGAVSDLDLSECRVRDREWQDAVIRLIIKAEVPVVPVAFLDGNSALYYILGLLDWRIRLLRLPAEVFNKRGMTMRIGIGPVVSVEEQHRFCSDIHAFREFLRDRVYGTGCAGRLFNGKNG